MNYPVSHINVAPFRQGLNLYIYKSTQTAKTKYYHMLHAYTCYFECQDKEEARRTQSISLS